MEPQFAIDDPDWNVSFQRRVGAANRGAIPYVPLSSSKDRKRIMVPLGAGEALWIAVMVGPATLVEGHAGDDPLRVEQLSQRKDGVVLLALAKVTRHGRPLPLDAASIEYVDDRARIESDALTIVLKNSRSAMIQQIGIVVATPRLYEAVSGLPAPAPTTERDEYQGWRLP
jgi:hypothetical protein